MLPELAPAVGQWYRNHQGLVFEVVAMDEEENQVEIQYFGGDIDELDLDSWEGLVAEAVEQPEDWSGPYDEMEKDDLGFDDTGKRPFMSLDDFE
ncbi:MAG: hypothetical protein OEZ68_11240 [Gammaproteobacteria bacterium]|nr:hypothetical protein [Gammaproteobacteria bacterium]MDH5801367.1 hypothetical protein [Gammaproteobacteria bacterium]